MSNKKLYHAVNIGNLKLDGNLFLAPVAGWSDCVFRAICRSFGSSFSYTEMVSAEAIVRNNFKTKELLKREPAHPIDPAIIESIKRAGGEPILLKSDNPSPYAVQLFGSDPAVMASAAEIVLGATKCDCIDINCGCPVKKITHTGSGSALMKNPELVGKIVLAIKEKISDKVSNGAATPPVTIKIRLGIDSNCENYLDVARAAIESGAAGVTLHARTAAQGYDGKSDWGKLKKLVDYIKKIDTKIMVAGSGDIFTSLDAKNMIETTGVDAVMIARGAMGNPFIFLEARGLLSGEKTDDTLPLPLSLRLGVALAELKILSYEIGERGACIEMRKRFSSYIRGVRGGKDLRQKAVSAESISDYEKILTSCESH